MAQNFLSIIFDNLWPTETVEDQINVLKPHGQVDFQTFVKRRRTIAIYFIIHAGSHVILVPYQFWEYLTTWGMIFAAAAFTYMWRMHVANGDFEKTQFERPSDEALTQEPWTKWKKVHALYEMSLHLQSMIVIAFWCMEFPYMALRGDLADLDVVLFSVLFFDHTVPMIVIFAEWKHNSISIKWARYKLYFTWGFIYITATVINSLAREDYYTYAMMPWKAHPVRSTIFLVIVLCLQVVSMETWVRATSWKLSSSGSMLETEETLNTLIKTQSICIELESQLSLIILE